MPRLLPSRIPSLLGALLLVAFAMVPRRSPAEQQVVPRAACPTGMAALIGGSFTSGERAVMATATVDKLAKVTVQGFCLDVTEVTVEAYTACVQAGHCTADHPRQWTADGVAFAADEACNYGAAGKGAHPMNCVDWTQATTYCQANGRRLPTEDEWEWAARGGAEGRTYPWGAAAPAGQLCWSGATKRTGTCAVGSYPAGDAPGGIHDLAGNVWEWTASNHEGDTRVRRGGGWINEDLSSPRAAHRGRSTPAFRSDLLGFRCAR